MIRPVRVVRRIDAAMVAVWVRLVVPSLSVPTTELSDTHRAIPFTDSSDELHAATPAGKRLVQLVTVTRERNARTGSVTHRLGIATVDE